MTARVVIEDTGFGLRAAILVDERLVEVRDSDREDPAATGALFVGRVTSVDAKLNAAFIDCGLPQPALLVAKDARAAAGSIERLPIRQLVQEGQRIVLQGVREAAGDKGARVTSDLKLFGYALVYSPVGQVVEPSQPTTGRRQADALRERRQSLFPDGRMALRRHAVTLPDAALLDEAERLVARWRKLDATARGAKPGRLPEPENALERLLRTLVDIGPAGIEVADRGLLIELERLLTTAATLPPWTLQRLEPDEPAFTQTGVDAALEQALGPEVQLARGGRLLIEPTAACVAIDVDGGGRAPLDVDLDAAGEVARQVRLRNLGGTIIVDFVDLPSRPERQRLEEALRKAFRHDPAPIEIHQMSSLGIVQLSRARRGAPLAARFSAACSCCGGTGIEPSARATAERLLIALQASGGVVLRIRVASGLRSYLASSAGWRHTVQRIGYQPELIADAALSAGDFVLEEASYGR
ncbi:MAG: ribonuclease E/G [Geminicoccaceae bacterium]